MGCGCGKNTTGTTWVVTLPDGSTVEKRWEHEANQLLRQHPGATKERKAIAAAV